MQDGSEPAGISIEENDANDDQVDFALFAIVSDCWLTSGK
jgi:hypothetical protein